MVNNGAVIGAEKNLMFKIGLLKSLFFCVCGGVLLIKDYILWLPLSVRLRSYKLRSTKCLPNHSIRDLIKYVCRISTIPQR